MSDFNQNVFGKKTFSDILKDIYDNSKKTEKQITELIVALKDQVDGPGSAAIIVPLIVQYLDVKVKNDDHLVKMAGIVQRALVKNDPSGKGPFMLTSEEEEALLKEAKQIISNQGEINKQLPSSSDTT